MCIMSERKDGHMESPFPTKHLWVHSVHLRARGWSVCRAASIQCVFYYYTGNGATVVHCLWCVCYPLSNLVSTRSKNPQRFSPLSQYLLSKLSKAWWHDRPGNMVIMFLIAVTHVSLLSNQQCKLIFVVFVAMSQCLHFIGTFCLEYQFSWACVEQYLSIELS